MIERFYWVVSFHINVKRLFLEVLEGEPQKTIGWARPLFSLTLKWLALCQIPWGRCWFNHFKYFENHKNLCQWIFGMLIIQNIRFLFRDAKYFFPCFSRVLPAKRLFQKIDCIVKSNPLPNPNFRFHPPPPPPPPSSLSLSLSRLILISARWHKCNFIDIWHRTDLCPLLLCCSDNSQKCEWN